MQKIIDNPPGSPGTTPGHTDVDLDENAVNTAARQRSTPRPVRAGDSEEVLQAFRRPLERHGAEQDLADIWNEVVWDCGPVNPVDLLDGKDAPDINPNSANKARRRSPDLVRPRRLPRRRHRASEHRKPSSNC
ncbi:MAG: hypothetical protein U5O16_19855 [Rhodococcus sp. (in: high G+C Gram-positive bacteria)]|uniref:hypothetical protein n=1 Tax=Rhodococcus sp. TaxID=1831 RepID=UPI002AD63B11|nr:hypothetical protein [Rhodococcus sp. (in: high G+C Gram-positive bacteria)]